MSQTALTVPRASDALIVGAFREVARGFGATHVTYQLLGGENNLEEPQDSSLLDAIAQRNSSVIYSANANLPVSVSGMSRAKPASSMNSNSPRTIAMATSSQTSRE